MHKYIPLSPAAQPGATPSVRVPTGSTTTIEEALREHEGLIHAVIRRHGSGVLTYEEALQAGRIGLWRALLRYDPTRGTAFSTYAWVAIRRAIQRAAQQITRGRRYETDLDTPNPQPDEVADPTADVVTLVEQGELRAALRDLVQQLPARQRWVIVARYGLDGRPPRPRPQLGAQLGCSKEWIRQLELAALAWLRHPAHSLTIRQLVGRNTAADYRQALARNAAWRRARKGRRRPRQGPGVVTLTAIQKRQANKEALARFAPANLQLPARFPQDPDLPPSPKPSDRSHYRYRGPDGLDDPQTLATYSNFDVAVRLFDYPNLERLLAAHIYVPSAKGQVPFHPVSMYLLRVYRREQGLSRHETLRRLRHQQDGRELRRRLGFTTAFPSESGLRYFEKQITPALQWEINARQMDLLYQAGLLPTRPEAAQKVPLSFDGMLHEARARMRCASVTAACYQPPPRPCRAQTKGKRGCDCTTDDCVPHCRYTTPRDPEARLVVYQGSNKRARDSPNTPQQPQDQQKKRSRFVYGYYSYAGQILDPDLATYWILPAAFGPATTDERTLFLANFPALQERFPWLHIDAVIVDAGACTQDCLDLIWEAGALRLVDICIATGDDDPAGQRLRGYTQCPVDDAQGYPLCPFGYVMASNGHTQCPVDDDQRRRTKWRCAKVCRQDDECAVPDCDYLNEQYVHGYTTTVGRTHADGTVRLAREIPYGSAAWKKRYHQRNSSESRNSVQEGLGLKRLPVHGTPRSNSEVLLGDFVANQRTLARLVREAVHLLPHLSSVAPDPAPSSDPHQPDPAVAPAAGRAPPL